MKHLYFCRHGESVLNAELRYSGHIDTPLSSLGRKQAKKAAANASELQLDLIVSSPLVRALETAQIIAAEANIPTDKLITNQLFIERNLGSIQGKPFSVGPEDSSPDAETHTELTARAQAALNYLQTLEADSILVVSHGSFAKSLCAVLNFNIGDEEPPNAEIFQLF